MNTILNDQLEMLALRHSPDKQKVAKGRLRVFYGWCKLGKIRKREGISIIYENQEGWRYQTEGEASDAKQLNRIFTEYCIFFDDKKIAGSLEAALRANSEADRYNVSTAERKRIADALRSSYMSEHRDYKEPVRQLDLFEEPNLFDL